jgi:hypothetical protein
VEYQLAFYPNDFNGMPIKPELPLDAQILGLKAFNVENARIFGWETSLVSKGNIGDFKITTLIGYTYTYPGNSDYSKQQAVGTFISNAFKYFAKRIPQSEDSLVLLFRSRHLVRGDIELGYKHISIGYSLGYNSFPEKIPQAFKAALIVVGGGAESFDNYINNHTGDLFMDARIAYEFSDKVKASVICKNLTNAFYYQRPGKVEPPRSITLQLSITL